MLIQQNQAKQEIREEGGEVGESVISYRHCSITVVMFPTNFSNNRCSRNQKILEIWMEDGINHRIFKMPFSIITGKKCIL